MHDLAQQILDIFDTHPNKGFQATRLLNIIGMDRSKTPLYQDVRDTLDSLVKTGQAISSRNGHYRKA